MRLDGRCRITAGAKEKPDTVRFEMSWDRLSVCSFHAARVQTGAYLGEGHPAECPLLGPLDLVEHRHSLEVHAVCSRAPVKIFHEREEANDRLFCPGSCMETDGSDVGLIGPAIHSPRAKSRASVVFSSPEHLKQHGLVYAPIKRTEDSTPLPLTPEGRGLETVSCGYGFGSLPLRALVPDGKDGDSTPVGKFLKSTIAAWWELYGTKVGPWLRCAHGHADLR